VTRTVYVNEAFRPQRVSGQQRYAREIADRLPSDFVRLAPSGFWAGSAVLTWLWCLLVLPLRSWRGVLVSLTARSPVWHPRHVVAVHDLFVLEHPEWFSTRYRVTHAPLQRLQLRTAHDLVAVSEPVATTVRALRPDLLVAVAPNAAGPAFTAAADGPGDLPERFGVRSGSYLVVVGNQEPRKNLARVAQAWASLSDGERLCQPLVVVGGGASIYAGDTVTWPPETVLAGYVSDDELVQLYAHSRAVLLLSLAEGFGLPIVEAAAAGASRLIVSDIPVFRWICGSTARYVDPRSVQAISAALAPAAVGGMELVGPDLGRRFDWIASAHTVAHVALRSAAPADRKVGQTVSEG
jgi:glycosyltransferase involved in cell wall biosynthesis